MRASRALLAALVAGAFLAPVAASAQEQNPPPGGCHLEWQPAPELTAEPLPVPVSTPYVRCIF